MTASNGCWISGATTRHSMCLPLGFEKGAFVEIFVHQSSQPMALPSQVFRQNFWMAHFGSRTPKRSSVWSGSKLIQRLDLGVLKKSNRPKKLDVTKTYYDKKGVKRFQGLSSLTQTQHRVCKVDFVSSFHPCEYKACDSSLFESQKIPQRCLYLCATPGSILIDLRLKS